MADARLRLPLQQLMEQRGRGPSNGNWKRFPKCPYCGKDGSGIYQDRWFKCWHATCPSGTSGLKGGWDEIGFLAYELSISRREAWRVWLQEAGVWEAEKPKPPSTSPTPEAPRASTDEVPAEPEERFEDLPPGAPTQSPGAPLRPESSAPETPVSEGGSSGEPDAASASAPAGSPAPGADGLPESKEFSAAAETPGGAEPSHGSEPAPPAVAVEEGEAAEASPAVSPGLQALRWFYRRLYLSDRDRTALWVKRGLTAATAAALGYRSNPRENRALLEAMAEHFPPGVLVESGLWSEASKPGGVPAPNAQFYGMSLVPQRGADGKKLRERSGRDSLTPVWDEPILIPYFDEAGELVHLRPHKGMMRERSARFYVVRHGKVDGPESKTDAGELKVVPRPNLAVICEGEFKAAAVWQTLNIKGQDPSVVVGSLPGITMAKPLFSEVEDWLESLGVRQVVIAYDSEEKGIAGLPGFHPDARRRHDAQIWARYLADQVSKIGYEGKVCVLPKAWRNAQGKADWDGRLADSLKSSSCPEAEVPAAVWAKIRAEWEGVVRAAVRASEVWQLEAFSSEEERIIDSGLKWISYEPRLPVGREKEEAIAKRLLRSASRTRGANNSNGDSASSLNPKQRGFLMALAKLYRGLSGRYYIFKQLKEEVLGGWMQLLEKARQDSDSELRRVVEIVVKGIPEAISDFYLEPLYVLHRGGESRERLVRVRNVHGMKTGAVRLPSAAFSQPSKFREWMLNVASGAAWTAGERPLQLLHEDFSMEMSFKDVSEVTVRMYEEESRCWFAGDVVYTPSGVAVFADDQGIVKVDGKKYRLGETDHEGQSFRHGEPRFGIGKSAVAVVEKLYGKATLERIKGEIGNPKDGAEAALERAALRHFFQDVATKFYETIGDYGGWLALGMCFLPAAGPELFETYNAVPSLWIHGEPRQGKTSLVRWLMRIFGLRVESGIPLKDSTKVGLSIALQQYGYGPVWLEEYQVDAPDWMVEKLKSVHDRAAGSKKTFDEGDRKIRAMAIVTGVATSTDAQLRSRFAHVQVSAEARSANHFKWFQEHCRDLVLFGRFLMEHRAEFAERTLAALREWLASAAMGEIRDERARLVHGAAYASFAAMVGLLESHAEGELAMFRTYLVQHCREALVEVNEAVNVNQLWRDALDALKSDAFGLTVHDRRRIFKVVENTSPRIKLSELQVKAGAEDRRKQWRSLRLYFVPGPFIAMLRQYKRSQGRELPLDRSDLRAQMRTRKYWVEPEGSRAGKGTHRIRFGGERGKTSEDCWCIELDLHELGYQPVNDEEFTASQYRDPEAGVFWPSDEWVDPRRGDLFALVDALEEKKQES